MKLRTITGTRWPAFCACGCHTRIEPSTTAKVVVDFDARPRRTWLPEHAPQEKDMPGFAPAAGPAPSAPPKETGSPSPTPPKGGPAPPPSRPEQGAPSSLPPAPLDVASASGQGHVFPKDPGPSPPAISRSGGSFGLALLGSAGASEPSPSANAGVAWATSQLTFNAGPYESAKSGFADYAQSGESPEQLRARVNRVVLEDIERQVRGIRELHERLGDVVKPFPAPARAAGAPSGASVVAPSSPPRMIVPPATPTVEGAGARPSPQGAPVGSGAQKPPAQIGSVEERPLKDLVREVRLDLSDADPLRLSRKMKVWVDWLGKRGYASANDVRPGDEWALERVLGDFEVVNRGVRP